MGDYGNAMMRNQDAGVQSRVKAQSRANLLQLKLIGQSHPTGLTTNLLKLFEPRPPLEHKPPLEKRKLPAYSGMSQFVSRFAEPGDPEYAPPVPTCETRLKRRIESVNLSLRKVQLRLLKSSRSMTHKMTPMSLEIHTKHSLLHDLATRHPSRRLKGTLKLMGLLKGYGS
ncbi:unnamed protein product [Triticum turgidum subsp. durum]|uniref:U1 small nuclear ribonucleoprotein of 70kDa N-terminal domain-containing protein n=1 Tax=Triticum turgidum subsp. durum TaxID=4567 RepID=A0A9R0Q4Z1_TRITD|nr:unnamed protein product [Triticum turgidum subsp. durum]